MITAEARSIIDKMESTGILIEKQMTFCEYTENLIRFQKMINEMIMKEEYVEGMRIEEAICTLEKRAREKGCTNEPKIRKGIQALRNVGKEIAISIAGKNGENMVARTLKFVQRPNIMSYRNVYVTDGVEETELDTVLVTDTGIMILEIKVTKNDITISPDGRIIRSNDECFEKMSMGEKMGQKRRLLKTKIQEEVNARGLVIPVQVDSLIVFSVPKGIRINVADQYHKEKWCFRTSLNHRVDDYISDIQYSPQEVCTIKEIIAGMELEQKKFDSYLNFDQIRNDIAEALAYLDSFEESINEVPLSFVNTEKKVVNISDMVKKCKKVRVHKKDTCMKIKKYYLPVVSGLASVLMVGAYALATGTIMALEDR